MNITLPTIFQQEAIPFFEPVGVAGVRRIDDIQKDVVEKSLKGRDGGAVGHQQRREGIGGCDSESKNLTELSVDHRTAVRAEAWGSSRYPSARTR